MQKGRLVLESGRDKAPLLRDRQWQERYLRRLSIEASTGLRDRSNRKGPTRCP